jgi:hypothetical protein
MRNMCNVNCCALVFLCSYSHNNKYVLACAVQRAVWMYVILLLNILWYD